MDILYPEDDFLEPDEMLRRIAPAFRYVVIDKVRGDRLVQEKFRELLDLGTPDVILEGHKSYFGRTVFVTVADDEGGDAQVTFLFQPYSRIHVEYESEAHRAKCLPTLQKLAGLLGYTLTSKAR